MVLKTGKKITLSIANTPNLDKTLAYSQERGWGTRQNQTWGEEELQQVCWKARGHDRAPLPWGSGLGLQPPGTP